MKTIKMLALAGWMTLATVCTAAPLAPPVATPDAARVQAAHDLMASMQAEKMMRTTAGMSRYASDAQRQAVFDKLAKVAPEEIYRRLALPVARLMTTETATEMSHFYSSSYGKRLLASTYNRAPSMGSSDPTPTKAEKAELRRPAHLKADQEFKALEAAIQHETFVLMTAIARK
jgi:hypothetical protein